jgi:predicted dehydrogenase
MIGICELCGRGDVEITGHHLIPRMRHNKKIRREYNALERNKTVQLCHPCHDQLHALFTEKELERDFNNLESLLAHPDVEKFVAWISKRAIGNKLKVKA